MASANKTARFDHSRRLLEASDFKRVFDNNNLRASSQHLLILAITHQTTLSAARLGMVVGKKNVRRAVDRNRIKRVTREYFRQNIATTITGIDFVLVVRQGAGELENKKIAVGLKTLFDSITRKNKKLPDQAARPPL